MKHYQRIMYKPDSCLNTKNVRPPALTPVSAYVELEDILGHIYGRHTQNLPCSEQPVRRTIRKRKEKKNILKRPVRDKSEEDLHIKRTIVQPMKLCYIVL